MKIELHFEKPLHEATPISIYEAGAPVARSQMTEVISVDAPGGCRVASIDTLELHDGSRITSRQVHAFAKEGLGGFSVTQSIASPSQSTRKDYLPSPDSLERRDL